MQSDILIDVKKLSRDYGPLRAVNDVSFEVKRGEVLGFLGPNGAGKSTTMQMLTGNLAPTEGQIIINGIDLLDNAKPAKAHIGFLPEQPPLYKELTVDEYLTFCARLNRIGKSSIADALATAKQRCGLEEVGKRLIGNLSKGFQQRVGIAQAIIHSPAVVILDEPTVGLDPIQIREIRRLIRELRGDHAVILSTHILPEVQTTCDRVQIINKGEIVLSDSVNGLQRYMQVSSTLVSFRKALQTHELNDLPDIDSVERLDDHSFRVHFDPQHNPADAIVKRSVDKDWGLLELTPEKRSLEEIFVDITTAEPATAEADTAKEEQAA
ncbi:MAG: ATP-binding cassette domain-containing protein [Gammaproteobacteria bacterium]|jgi:ABC-2 type transport system ATP-binding protein